MSLSHSACKVVEVGERDRLIVGGVVDEDIETAEALAHVADQPLHCRTIGDVAGERSGVDLIAGCQLAGDAFRLLAALGIHDGDMGALFGERVADALAKPAVTARHQCDGACEVHEPSPASGPAVVSRCLLV
jgi:hypothetical protein